MNWEDRMQMAYEAQTDRMIDDMYAPRAVECSTCENYFNEDDALETELCSKLVFCCDSCLEDWEEEFGWEYREEESQLTIHVSSQPVGQPSTQQTIYPVTWTTNHPLTQVV